VAAPLTAAASARRYAAGSDRACRGGGRPPGAGILTPGKITLKGGACGTVTCDSLREPWTVIFPGMTGAYRDDGVMR
jgi:hypothetical protein